MAHSDPKAAAIFRDLLVQEAREVFGPEPCPKCKNGRGKYRRTKPWPPRTITCPHCKGTGVITQAEPQEPDA